jgi:hypothetical protein
MTAQFSEILRYKGEEVTLFTNPLEPYFSKNGIKPPFISPHTALWRGYVGTWEIKEERLYLVNLECYLPDNKKGALSTLFPDYPGRVFAHWYSGTLRIPKGERLKYVHGGYGSIYEKDHFIDIYKGVVTESRIQINGYDKSKPGPQPFYLLGEKITPSKKET